jgi:cytochrome oxidase Cu insertion factor (SCO1/SenC/PrrC family)
MFPGKVEEMKAKFGPLLRILSINAINPTPAALDEVKKYGMNFQVLEGRGSGVTKNYQISNLPMLIIIDKAGKIRTYTQYLKYDDLKKAVIPHIKDIVEQ